MIYLDMNVLVDIYESSTAKAQVLRKDHRIPPTAEAIALASRAIVNVKGKFTRSFFTFMHCSFQGT